MSSFEKEELGLYYPKRNKESLQHNLGKEDTSVEFRQKKQWLKENSAPLDKVIQFMEDTFEGRRFEIIQNIPNIISVWPRILNPHVVSN